MSHKEFIEALGNGSVIADWVTEAAGEVVDREAVYKWSQNGVPHKWRPFIAKMAKQKGVRLPKDFIPGVAA